MPLGPGAIFGEEAIAPGAAAKAAVRAVDELDTVQVRRRDLDLIAYAFPAVAQRVGLTEPGAQPERIVLLESAGDAAHRLADELSRYSGRRVLLLIVGDASATPDALLTGSLPAEPGVDVLVRRPEEIGATATGLAVVCEHVLVAGRGLRDVDGARRIALDPAADLGRLARELAHLTVGVAGSPDALEPLGIRPDVVADTPAACERQGADVVIDLAGGDSATNATVVRVGGPIEQALPRIAAALPWLS
jgi:hypothetical protein